MDSQPVALVTDTERGSAVAVIRALHAEGWRVVAAATHRSAPGLHSRSTYARLVHADPAEVPDLAAQQITAAIREHQCQLVFPITDLMLRLCRRAALPRSAVVAAAPPENYEAASDKWATVEAARRLAIPVPDSRLANSAAEVRTAAMELGWPVVLKPRWSVTEDHGSFQRHDVTIAEGPDQLTRAEEDTPGGIIVQGFHSGAGVGVELLLDQGKVLAAFQHRRLREYPIGGGPSSLRVSEALDPDLLAWSTQLLGELKWTGLAMVEFKVGKNGPSLMEINARVWGSMPLATRSGVDFPALAAAVHLGRPPLTGPAPYRVGVRSRDLRLEMMWIAAVMRGGPPLVDGPRPSRWSALSAAMRLPLPGDGYDVVTFRDPGASMADIRQAVRHLLRKARSSR